MATPGLHPELVAETGCNASKRGEQQWLICSGQWGRQKHSPWPSFLCVFENQDPTPLYGGGNWGVVTKWGINMKCLCFFQWLISEVFSWIPIPHPLASLADSITLCSLSVIKISVHCGLKCQSQNLGVSLTLISSLVPTTGLSWGLGDLGQECINCLFTFPQIQHFGIERGLIGRSRVAMEEKQSTVYSRLTLSWVNQYVFL